jgi:catechol 2,3-dioxygenase-like lactoylglutathione lyase family enzyme
MRPKTLDHVALWVADREPIAAFLTGHLGMHVIEETERFTLVGSDALHGKLTLFVAEGPRERGALEHVAFRVSDLRGAVAALPDGLVAEAPREGELYFDVSEGLRLGLVEAPAAVEYDLDHVAVRSAVPSQTADQYEQFGFAPAAPGPSRAPRVEVGGAWVEFHEGDPGEPEKPLLNHLAVLVDSVDEHVADAEDLGIEVADVVDAPNTLAVFLWGPEHVKIEYVEHKPTFSLR